MALDFTEWLDEDKVMAQEPQGEKRTVVPELKYLHSPDLLDLENEKPGDP